MTVVSMTGFGQASRENERCRVTVSIRSVNHRFLDVSLRLPDALRDHEPELRRDLAERVGRGRVEVRVQVDALRPPAAGIEVRRELVDRLAELARELEDRGLASGGLRPGDVLAFPEAVRVVVGESDWGDGETALLRAAVDEALEQALAGRAAEGRRLAEALEALLRQLSDLASELESGREDVRRRLYESLQSRLRELLADVELPEERLVQEAAILADRGDVREELDRLAAHVDHFREVARGDGPAGRRLDFLTQEILRELNTIGSKCRDARMAEAVVEAKVVCEQLREQVQNVE